MARIRSIKPAFFRHEKLQELGAEAMLVFAGLWTQCDSRGRFEWKPRHLKLDILPFMDFDMGVVLGHLCTAGFILKYSVDGKEYGEIESFLTHQRITGKESESGEHYPENPGKQLGINGETTGKHPDAQEGEEERGIGRGKDTRRESGGEFASGNSGKPVWSLICEVWGFEPKTQTEFKRIEALFRDFTAKSGSDLEKIRTTVRRYGKVFPAGTVCTPEAVLKHWDACQPPKVATKPVQAVDLARIQREEQEEAEWASKPEEERARILENTYADIRRLAGTK